MSWDVEKHSFFYNKIHIYKRRFYSKIDPFEFFLKDFYWNISERVNRFMLWTKNKTNSWLSITKDSKYSVSRETYHFSLTNTSFSFLCDSFTIIAPNRIRRRFRIHIPHQKIATEQSLSIMKWILKGVWQFIIFILIHL